MEERNKKRGGGVSDVIPEPKKGVETSVTKFGSVCPNFPNNFGGVPLPKLNTPLEKIRSRIQINLGEFLKFEMRWSNSAKLGEFQKFVQIL